MTAAERGIAVDDRNVTCLTVYGRALLSIREGELDRSVLRAIDEKLTPAMERLLEIDLDGWIAPKALGAIALERGDYDSAVEYLARLMRVRPLDPASDRGLAGVYLKRGDDERALPHLREMAMTEQDDAAIASTIGAICIRKHEYPEARYWFTRSLYIDPFNVDTHESLAEACMELDDLRGAVREYESLCILQPTESGHFERAARTHKALGNDDDAQRFARQALQLDPTTSVGSLAIESNP